MHRSCNKSALALRSNLQTKYAFYRWSLMSLALCLTLSCVH